MQAIGPPPRPDDYAPRGDLPRAASRGDGTRLWLVRHAEVAERWHETAYGAMDVELSERGEAQTRAMAAAFDGRRLDRVLASDLERARRMGEGIARATGAPVEATHALREMHRGEWQGLSKADFGARWRAEGARYWSDPYRWAAPGGEGDALLWERAWPAVEPALLAHAGGDLLVAAHGQLIRVLTSRALGLDVPESYELYLDPAHAHLVVDAPGGWRLEARNLPAEAVAAR
jgi:broad specificity phosphatase PhoE